MAKQVQKFPAFGRFGICTLFSL